MAQRQNASKQSKGKRNRKHGRWLRKPSYKRYLAEQRWLKNKARRIKRYIRRHGYKPESFPHLSDAVKILAGIGR